MNWTPIIKFLIFSGVLLVALSLFFCGCNVLSTVITAVTSPVSALGVGIESILTSIGNGLFAIFSAIGNGIQDILSGQVLVNLLCVIFKPDCACGCN